MRPRGRDKHLPRCVYHRHGAYWYVKRKVWTHLGFTLSSALAEYARIVQPDIGGCDDLFDRTLVKCRETVRDSTHEQYSLACRRAKKILAEFTPDGVEPHHIATIVDKLRISPNAANRMLTFLRLSFSNGLTWGMCRTNPCYGVKRLHEGRRSRLLSQEEYQAIWEAAPPQLRAIMDVAYFTGQRIGDVLGIRLSNISKEGIAFEQQKTGKRLMVAMTQELAETVERARNLHSNVRGLTLFHGRGGKPLSYFGVRSAFQRACKASKVEDATLHDIRAKSATDAKKQGKNATALLGHTTQAQTVRYLRDRDFELVNGPSIGQPLANWTEDSKKSKA